MSISKPQSIQIHLTNNQHQNKDKNDENLTQKHIKKKIIIDYSTNHK
jgi:hypothetical protein